MISLNVLGQYFVHEAKVDKMPILSVWLRSYRDTVSSIAFGD